MGEKVTKQFLIFALLAFAMTAFATDPVNTSFSGLAVKGYDVVAYFDEGKPVRGEKAYSYDWNGATWRFVSEAHLTQFKANPEKYAPKYGGYCAWAVSQGYTAKIDPEAWKIVNGGLYLNYNKKVQGQWEADISGFIAKADQNWPKILAE